jgi:hypothetical protein
MAILETKKITNISNFEKVGSRSTGFTNEIKVGNA